MNADHDLSLFASLRRAADRWPDRPALCIDGETKTFADLYEEGEATARLLWDLGLRPGERLLLFMANCHDYVRLIHAAAKLGAIAVAVNARFRGEELRHAILHADPAIIATGGHARPEVDHRALLLEAFPELAEPAAATSVLPELRGWLCFTHPEVGTWPMGGALRRERRTGAGTRLPPEPDPGACALMMFSSGTTARPKACLLTHRQIWRVGSGFAERFRLTPADVIYNPLPFFHMSTMLPMAACRASGALQLATRHFEPAEGLKAMAEHRATFAYVSFPTLVAALVSHPNFATTDLSALRYLQCVGPPETLRRFAEAFPGAYPVNAYGLTEAAGVPVWSDPDDPAELSILTSGKPLPGVEVKAVDPKTGADLPPNTQGELWIRGWAVFPGYWRDPEATAAVLRPDGWLRTGDLGRIDREGRVFYEGRLKDMIKVGGENVAALEIEALLCRHPAIQIAQVIGVPDARLGEVPAAFIQLVPGAELSAREVIEFCLGRIARFKIPRYVRFVSDWPMSATKIQKFRLPRTFAPEERFFIRTLLEQRQKEGGPNRDVR